MSSIGDKLRRIRLRWGLSLREVKDRSSKLAKEWGSDSYEISGSWLARLERGQHEMTVPKLVTLATIYSESPEQLLRDIHPNRDQLLPEDHPGPNMTVLVNGGRLETRASQLIPDGFNTAPIPENTVLLPRDNTLVPSQYRRAIIGTKNLSLFPVVRPGSIVNVDTLQKAIAPRKDWNHEFDRPIYLLMTHAGYVCGWCDLDETGFWLTLITHSLSKQPYQRWRYRKEVEVVGRVVAVAMRLTA
jgi:transcriptional regulator with XRE-family HTH domain